MTPVLKFQLPCYIFIVSRLFGHYFNSMQALRALLIFALLTLAASSHEKPSDLKYLITSPSCKTAEECYEKEIMTMDNKPLQVPRKACSVHHACKCIPLAVDTCRPMHSDRTGCPTSLQCHSRYKDNCEKDSVCMTFLSTLFNCFPESSLYCRTARS